MEAGCSHHLFKQPAFPVSDRVASVHGLPMHPLHHLQSVPVITSLENPLVVTRNVPSVATTPSLVTSPVQHAQYVHNLAISSGVCRSKRDYHSQFGWTTQPASMPSSGLRPARTTVLDIDPRLLLDRPANPPPQLTDSCIQAVIPMQPVSFIPSSGSVLFQPAYSISDCGMVRNSVFQPQNFSHM